MYVDIVKDYFLSKFSFFQMLCFLSLTESLILVSVCVFYSVDV